MSDSTFERYLQAVQFSKLLEDLGIKNVDALAERARLEFRLRRCLESTVKALVAAQNFSLLL